MNIKKWFLRLLAYKLGRVIRGFIIFPLIIILIGFVFAIAMKPAKPRCAKLHNWKPPKPKDVFLVCMNCGRCLSLSSLEDEFKINAIIQRSERLTEAILKDRAAAPKPEQTATNRFFDRATRKQGKTTAFLPARAAARDNVEPPMLYAPSKRVVGARERSFGVCRTDGSSGSLIQPTLRRVISTPKPASKSWTPSKL